ncbi:MAG: hypothetical protein ACLQU3_04785 [Limisphaerales bacterium]
MARTALNTTASAERPYVSKSKFLWGAQCRKLLWIAYNAKDQIPEPDAATQAIFDQGHEVGALAKALYPGGIIVAYALTGAPLKNSRLTKYESEDAAANADVI